MYEIKIENSKNMGTIPTIQINLYDQDTNLIVDRGIIMPYNNIAFKCFKLKINSDGAYDIIGTTYGTSPHVPFDMYFTAGNEDIIDKKLILGQFMLCVLDFIDIQNILGGYDSKIIAPSIGRSIKGTEIERYIDTVLNCTRRAK